MYMMKSKFLLQVVPLLVCFSLKVKVLYANKNVVPTAWPEEFSIDFYTNVNTTLPPDEQGDFINGKMYYNWPLRAQRVDHDEGNAECVNFYNSKLGCSLYFLPEGLYRVLEEPLPPNQPKCCLDMDSIHASPPDWAAEDEEFLGIVNEPYSGYFAYKFDFVPESTNLNKYHLQKTISKFGKAAIVSSKYHEYYQVAPLQNYETRPLLFTFPAHDGVQDFHFLPETMDIVPQDKALFDLPKGCKNVKCPSS